MLFLVRNYGELGFIYENIIMVSLIYNRTDHILYDKNIMDLTSFIYIGDATDIRYAVLTNCDLQQVGEEFSRKPYALAVQQGSPLKDILNDG